RVDVYNARKEKYNRQRFRDLPSALRSRLVNIDVELMPGKLDTFARKGKEWTKEDGKQYPNPWEGSHIRYNASAKIGKRELTLVMLDTEPTDSEKLAINGLV